MAKAGRVGRETALVSIADSMLSKVDKQDTKENNAELCQDRVGQSFKILDSQKSLSIY